MAEAEALVDRLVALQSADGGWPYQSGMSWAEPTAFVVLALQSSRNPSTKPALDRGISWLLGQQKESGGWPPNANVKECTWVTSVAALAVLRFAKRQAPVKLDAALQWTAGQVYQDDYSFALLLAKALNLPPAHAPGSVPWYPGTAGWVTPTALTALVLFQADRETNRPELRRVAAQASSYLLSRRCADHGWNHGGSKTRSEDATSYPETTGLALLALHAAGITPPPESISLAQQLATKPESMEGLAWLQMALHSLYQRVVDPPRMPHPRTTRDAALRVLSLAALEGRNIFLGA